MQFLKSKLFPVDTCYPAFYTTIAFKSYIPQVSLGECFVFTCTKWLIPRTCEVRYSPPQELLNL